MFGPVRTLARHADVALGAVVLLRQAGTAATLQPVIDGWSQTGSHPDDDDNRTQLAAREITRAGACALYEAQHGFQIFFFALRGRHVQYRLDVMQMLQHGRDCIFGASFGDRVDDGAVFAMRAGRYRR